MILLPTQWPTASLCSLPLALLLGLLLASTTSAAEPPAKQVSADHAQQAKQGLALFQGEVRALLTQHCVECHGDKSVKADFDLSTRQALLDSGYVDETAADSYLMLLIQHEAEPHMPFKKPKLSEQQIASIGRWIDLGAPYDKPLIEPKSLAETESHIRVIDEHDRQFWSFLPLQQPAPPGIEHESWVRTPVDRFVLAKLEAEGIAPNQQASRRVLIRRAYFDLLGLPPSPAEVETFVSDPDPAAYDKLIDRLLDSPHYGERWARHWIDIARFAESHGYEQDYDRPHAYHYRDFLIKAFNNDMPYDQFLSWQLAGDELAPDNPQALIATGFLGAGPFPTQLTEAEFESARYDELDDMIGTLGVSMLGLSIGCARCHDHKFDPIGNWDYYRMAATFTTTIRSEIELDLAPEANQQIRQDHAKRLAMLKAEHAGLNDSADEATRAELEQQISKLEKEGPPVKLTKVQVTSEGVPKMKHHANGRGFPHFYEQTYFLNRGDVKQKQEPVEPGFLRVLMPAEYDVAHWQVGPPADWEQTSFRRATLANWLTDLDQGAGQLAARVMVNRLWQHHLGRGIVATPNDFGFSGERPTHPQLLDYLASELVKGEWKLKRLHKLIMTSSVYRQAGTFDQQRASVNRQNQLYWRREPQRLEAEPLRDAMLAISGRLDRRMYGPGTLNESMQRRSIYFFIKRSELIPTMMLFDWPEHLVSIGQRASTTTAPQALMFMNSQLGRKSAEGLAERMRGEPRGERGELKEAVERGFRLTLGRSASEEELAASLAFIERQEQSYRAAGESGPREHALIDFAQSLFSMNEFIYVE